MTKITKDILISELIKKHPSSIGVLQDYGMQCIGCHVATWETLEQASQSHGIDINKLLEELNKGLK